MNISGLTKAYLAAAILTSFRIVKHGAADGEVIMAAAAADKSIGVTTEIASAAGETADIIKTGLANVEYGGAVTRGDPLTSDASGRAVVAAPAAGANVRLIGYAEVSGVLGDIGQVAIFPSVMQG